MPSSTKAINFARIVHRLMTDARGWRIDLLKRELEIADRTWRKYRQDLQDYFEPFWDERGTSMVEEVEVGEHRYVRLRRPMDSIGPSDAGAFRARLAAMHLARRMFGYLEQTSIGDQLRSLIRRFEDSFRDMVAAKHFLTHVDRKLHVIEGAHKDYDASGETLQSLVHAVLSERHVDTIYRSAMSANHAEERSSRTQRLEPLSIVSSRGALYLLARPVRPEADEEQPILTYAVDRFEQVEITDVSFDYPSEVAFDPDSFFEGHFGIFQRHGGEEMEVELIFADIGWLKIFLQERQWHPDQRFTELEDGRLRMTFPISTMGRVWPWIRSFGKDVQVVKPAGPIPMTAAAQRAWRKSRKVQRSRKK